MPEPKRPKENAAEGDDREAPVSSGRPVINEDIQAYADSVRTRLGIFTPAGKKGEKNLKKLKLKALEEGSHPARKKRSNPAAREKRMQIYETMRSELLQYLANPNSNLADKARILKKAILALDPHDRTAESGRIQFLIYTCVPNIKKELLNVHAQSIALLLSENRRIDAILMEIVNIYLKNVDIHALMMADSSLAGIGDSSDASVAGVMGVAYVGPNPDKPASGFDANGDTEEESDFEGMVIDEEPGDVV